MSRLVDTHSHQPSLTMTAQVIRLSPAGLVVKLPNGREGVVREREIAWDAETRRGWRERYQPGDFVKVALLGKKARCRPELSLRLAQTDSWTDAEERYRVGEIVEGVITGIMSYGVFVELAPGISGLAHRSRLPAWMNNTPGTYSGRVTSYM